MNRHEFIVRRLRNDGTPSRRFHKLLYTAALRLGVVPQTTGEKLKIELIGAPNNNSVQTHKQNREVWDGTLTFFDSQASNSRVDFSNITAILERTDRGSYHLITFWPKLQNPDARDSYTDPLVDIAMSAEVPDLFLEYVANVMHKEFVENPGMSPAVAVQELNQELLKSIQLSASEEIARWKVTVERALVAHEEALAIADAYKGQADTFRDENERLQVLLEQAISQQKSELATTNKSPPNAEAVTPVWASLTGSSYKNICIKAYIVSVVPSGNNILVKYIDKNGTEKDITDFGRHGFVLHVFEYLKSREKNTAIFIITYKSDGIAKLASDTMMLPQYSYFWNC